LPFPTCPEGHEKILTRAATLKKLLKQGKPHQTLKGRSLGMIFEKASTRTRVSFEVGMFQLGGQALFLSPNDLQIGRGEPIADTARTLSRYLDGIMIRTYAHETVEELAHFASIPVINGLTDVHHPARPLRTCSPSRRKEELEGTHARVRGRRQQCRQLTYSGLCEGRHALAIATPAGMSLTVLS